MADDGSRYARWRQQVREEWTSEVTVAGWRKWFAKADAASREVTDALLGAATIAPDQQVLDIASGSGVPALALAKAVGPAGHVTATDLSADMLMAAAQHARQAGLANISFQPADAEALPFPDQSFDRVTCRWGAMYFADVERALREIHRVLKPGGQAAFAAWGPLDQNPLFLLFEPFMRRITLPPSEPGAPSPLRFAEAGTLSAAMRQAGFRQVTEDTIPMTYAWAGSPEELRASELEQAGPFQALIESLSQEQRTEAMDEMLAGYRRYDTGQQVAVPMVIVIASGICHGRSNE